MQPDTTTTATPRQTTSREFIAILFRRKWVILGLFAATTLTVVGISATTPVEYVSYGRVLIKRGEKESLLSPSRRVYSDWEEDMGSEVEVVKSQSVLDRARALLAEEAGPGRTATPLRPRGVDVEVKGRTNVVTIGYVDGDPLVARSVCDALLRAYVEFRQNDFAMADPHDFFEGEIDRVQKDLDYWTSMRRNFAERSNVVDLQVQRSADIGRLAMLEQREDEIQTDLADAEMAARRMSELRDQGNFDSPSFSAMFTNETALMELKRRVVDQEFHVASLKEKMRDDSPEVTAAVVTLDTLRAMMQREVDSRASASQIRIDVLHARLAVVQRDIAALRGSLATLPDKEMSLTEMDHKIDILKQRHKELTQNSDLARITKRTSPERNVVLLSRAGKPAPQNARDYVRLALAPAFSLVIGIGLAFFLDGLDLTVRTAHHAEDAVHLPVLATLLERRTGRREGDLAPEGVVS
jgi:uncharacterized protein involved in exopolysaccharide biosynthesis